MDAVNLGDGFPLTLTPQPIDYPYGDLRIECKNEGKGHPRGLFSVTDAGLPDVYTIISPDRSEF
jgi:hypothetical protein